jgi:hypothetical protein
VLPVKAIVDENNIPRLRRILVCLQGVAIGAESNSATVATTPETDEKTSELVYFLTKIA